MKIIDFIRKITGRDKKIKKIEQPKTRYQELVESIDDLELCHMFVSSLTPELKEFDKEFGKMASSYPLRTQIYTSYAIDLAMDFYSMFGYDILEQIDDVLDGEGGKFIFQIGGKTGKGSYVSNPEKFPIEVYIEEKNDLNMVYEIIHELAHTLDLQNGDTDTRKILGEVTPQCIERLFDEFLLNMPEEELFKYGFDEEVLKSDIRKRRAMTFLSRLHNAQTLEHDKKADRVVESRYMLAQIYSSQFLKIPSEERIKKITQFIECVKNDDFEGANEVFGMRIRKQDKLQRRFCIDDTIIDAEEICDKREEEELFITTKSDKTKIRTQRNNRRQTSTGAR